MPFCDHLCFSADPDLILKKRERLKGGGGKREEGNRERERQRERRLTVGYLTSKHNFKPSPMTQCS